MTVSALCMFCGEALDGGHPGSHGVCATCKPHWLQPLPWLDDELAEVDRRHPAATKQAAARTELLARALARVDIPVAPVTGDVLAVPVEWAALVTGDERLRVASLEEDVPGSSLVLLAVSGVEVWHNCRSCGSIAAVIRRVEGR